MPIFSCCIYTVFPLEPLSWGSRKIWFNKHWIFLLSFYSAGEFTWRYLLRKFNCIHALQKSHTKPFDQKKKKKKKRWWNCDCNLSMILFKEFFLLFKVFSFIWIKARHITWNTDIELYCCNSCWARSPLNTNSVHFLTDHQSLYRSPSTKFYWGYM